MFPPTKADWKSPKFWMNWTTWWVSRTDAFPVFAFIDEILLWTLKALLLSCRSHSASACPKCSYCYNIGAHGAIIPYSYMRRHPHACQP